MVQPTRRPCGNTWSEILVRFTMGREQNVTLGCEERDKAVRSGSKVATERFVAFRTRQGILSRISGLSTEPKLQFRLGFCQVPYATTTHLVMSE
ncbi:hypothetical protein Taro_040206 [Colocasia esculenta]|uniref:Uncharacterized protein n=1 Tax=Colocasia esculenta TaxID=4460 RepID=A0A843WSC1_COLES|nr:hypothetical protein [Colocasia esculenta]